MITRLLEGPRIRQQAIARTFVERFRAIAGRSRAPRLARLDRPLPRDGPVGPRPRGGATRWACTSRCAGCIPTCAASSRRFMRDAYPGWLANLEGDRPPLSIDIVGEFLLPVLQRDKRGGVHRHRLPAARPVGGARARSSRRCSTIETTHYFGVLPTATPYSRNALFSGLFPERDRRALSRLVGRARGRDAQRARAGAARGAARRAQAPGAGALREDLDVARLGRARAPHGQRDRAARGSARSSSTSSTCSRTGARSRRSCTRSRATRSRSASSRCSGSSARRCSACCKEAARRKVKVLVTSDHGSIHCHTPATVFAKRDATQNLRYKFGEDLRAENPEYALLVQERGCAEAAAARLGREHAARRRVTPSSCIRRSCASTRAGTAARFCTAA